MERCCQFDRHDHHEIILMKCKSLVSSLAVSMETSDRKDDHKESMYSLDRALSVVFLQYYLILRTALSWDIEDRDVGPECNKIPQKKIKPTTEVHIKEKIMNYKYVIEWKTGVIIQRRFCNIDKHVEELHRLYIMGAIKSWRRLNRYHHILTRLLNLYSSVDGERKLIRLSIPSRFRLPSSSIAPRSTMQSIPI